MDRFLYTAVSGAQRVQELQAIRANNLANSDTVGFRADLEAVVAKTLGAEDSARTLPEIQAQVFSNEAGQLRPTGRVLDLAIAGEGWFTLAADGGEAYTRNGQVKISAEGQLQVDGLPLMGPDGPLELPEYRDIFVGDNGLISVVPADGGAIQEVGQLKLVNPDVGQLEKGQDGLVRSRNGAVIPADEQVQVKSGFLEQSNVDAIGELMASMDLTRQFEIQAKLMKSAERIGKSGNSLLSNV